MTVLKMTSLTVGHGSHAVIRDIIADVPEGCCVLLAGANGSGKSTLLKTLSGLLSPLSGSISSEAEIILVPTGIPKVKGFTVSDFVSTSFYSLTRWSVRMDHSLEEHAMNALKMLGIQEFRDRDISTLSDGEFQKACVAAAVARVLACSGRGVLLLDEPTAFLDVDARASLSMTLSDLAHTHGVTVIFSSHDIYGQLSLVDHIMAITPDGRLVFSSSEEASKKSALSQAFSSYHD